MHPHQTQTLCYLFFPSSCQVGSLDYFFNMFNIYVVYILKLLLPKKQTKINKKNNILLLPVKFRNSVDHCCTVVISFEFQHWKISIWIPNPDLLYSILTLLRKTAKSVYSLFWTRLGCSWLTSFSVFLRQWVGCWDWLVDQVDLL